MVTFMGGIVATVLFAIFRNEFVTALALIYFVPLALRASHDVSVWSLAMSVSGEREGGAGGARLARFFAREYLYALAAAFLVSSLAFALVMVWTTSMVPLVAGAAGLFAGVAVAGILGLVLPLAMRKMKLDPVLAPGRLIGVAVMAVSLLSFLVVSGLLCPRVALGATGERMTGDGLTGDDRRRSRTE